MTEEQVQQNPGSDSTQQDWQELVRSVAKRVWELWREELRRDRERRSKARRR